MAAALHIAFFNRSFHPDTAATGQLLTELCEGLVRDHHCRVSVVAGGTPLQACAGGEPRQAGGETQWKRWGLVQRERYRGIEILRARGTRWPKRRFVGRFSNYVTYFLSACYAGVRLDRPDVVVALTDPPIIGLGAYLASRRFGVPFVMSVRDVFPEVGRLLEDFHSTTVDRVLEGVTRFLVRNADRTVALGDTMRQTLIDRKGADPARCLVIPDWADCSAIAPGPKRNPFALAHGLADQFVVMHSGNIGLSQGLETLIQAAARLREWPDIQFVFVGDGVKRPDLEAEVRARGLRNVRFLPYQPKERLAESFATADVFVISLKTGLAGCIVPSKLYGILAAGRPYVAAVDERSEVAAVARRHDCGLLAAPGMPADLAEKILTLYRDRPLAERLGANARIAARRFDRPRQVRSYYRLLEDLASEAARAREARVPRLKRPFDVALATLGLLCSSPLWVLIPLAIKADDGGAVFYRSRRVGRGGRGFTSWKFRSMTPGAGPISGLRQATNGDRRVTRVGRVLRATALDELPQLWNILKGEMSVVGPRPLLPEEIEVRGGGSLVALEKIPGYDRRHQVRPGLTGLAQVYAPRDLPRRLKFRFDLLYIKRHTFWLDLKLIVLSFWVTVRGQWEHRGRKL